ncbi:MAG: amidohydrolase family protein [Chloroflexi bacterium]|nr:amidohydrolase family protein [Chloroflexota bacterium]
MIIDAHAHIMTAVNGMTASGPTRSLSWGQVRWGEETIQLLPPFCETTAFPAEALLAQMDWAGVERAALLQGPFYGEANAYVASAVERFPDRFMGAFAPDPLAPDVRQVYEQCVEEYGLRILKFELTEPTGLTGLHPDLRLDAPEQGWIFEAAEKDGLVVTLDLGKIGSRAYQTEAVAALAERHPNLTFVIAHLAQPPIGEGEDDNVELDDKWSEQILLGRRRNVFFDLSALPAYAADFDEYPYAAARMYIKRAVDLIGAEKIMWGADAPGLLTSGSYRQLLNYVRLHCDFLSEAELADVLGLNALRVYWRATPHPPAPSPAN